VKRSERRDYAAVLRHSRALETRVKDLENLRVLPGTTLCAEEEIPVPRPGLWAWTLMGIVAGAIVGFVVMRLVPPIPIATYSAWCRGLVWAGVGMIVLGVFVLIGARHKRKKMLVPKAVPPGMLRATGAKAGTA
jgi:hypothetical protein